MPARPFYTLVFAPAIICLLFFSCASNKKFKRWEDKAIAAVYSGGHKWDVSLTLYNDSTFVYSIKDDILGLGKKKKGAYLMTDTSITLYRWESKIVRYKYWLEEQTFRVRGDRVLMYTEDQEQSKDSSFYRAYYTLSLDK